MRVGDEGCKACQGGAIPCKGGGNLDCWRREPRRQRVAIILDTYGSARTIVGTLKAIRANTRRDELVHVVPGLSVHEPIAWNDIPVVIARAALELDKWLATRPNLDETQYEAVAMYRLRTLEHEQQSLDLGAIVET